MLKRARETIEECLPSYRPMDFMHNDEQNTRICVALFKLSCIKHRPRVELSKEEEADVEHIVTKLLVGSFHKPWKAPNHNPCACQSLESHQISDWYHLPLHRQFIKMWELTHYATMHAIHCFCRAGLVC